MVKVKFCGMTNYEDCRKAVDLGVDYIGFVFFKKSKRYVTPEKVRDITSRFGGAIRTIGVFVDESDKEIRDIMAYSDIETAQLYRQSSVNPRIRVYRIADMLPDRVEDGLILLDSYSDGFGGSGRSFDFNLLTGFEAINRTFIAGGINEDNVERVLALHPYGVDLVSAVEAQPGKKDHTKMEEFMKTVRSYRI